jgi:hypothetical protein
MEREPECYKVFQVFTTVMGIVASGMFLIGLAGILAYGVEPATSVSPTVSILLLVSGLGLLFASAAGGLFLNLVKNVHLTTVQSQMALRHLAEINPKEHARREAKFQPRTLTVPSAISMRPARASGRRGSIE